jgi:hypothetical protein
MATPRSSASRKQMCAMCSPKQVAAITSCKGCLADLCRRHFNEHRDILSKNLHNVFDLHDDLLEELRLKMDPISKPSDNDNARAILKQIDEWEMTTFARVSQEADKARAHVEHVFNRKMEFDQLKQKIGKITEELKEQQEESDSFVETDIEHWIDQLERLRIDLNRPSKFETNPPVLQIQNIDWNTIIKICSPFKEASAYLARNPMNTGSFCMKFSKKFRTKMRRMQGQ